MSVDEYTVVLRGETFTLYRDQIEFDSPNYFTALFLGEFRESRTQRVALSRSPELFRVVVEYMSGYTILPLAPAMIPPTMTPETALANLLNDAEYYRLSGLVRLIRPAPHALIGPPEAYRALNLAPRATLNFEDVISGANLNVTFDAAAGIGIREEQNWLPVLISSEGMRLIYQSQTLRPMLSTRQKEGLAAFTPNIYTGPYTFDGAPYWLPVFTGFAPYATMRFNGQNISPLTINKLCFRVELTGVRVPLDLIPPAETTAFRALGATKADGGEIILWCRQLVFTIAATRGGLGFRILHVDCVTRERFVSELIF